MTAQRLRRAAPCSKRHQAARCCSALGAAPARRSRQLSVSSYHIKQHRSAQRSRRQRCSASPSGAIWRLNCTRGAFQLASQADAKLKELQALLSAGPTEDQLVQQLHLCIEKGFRQCVQLLLAAGAPVNAGDTDGRTALHVAAACGKPKIAAALIQAGAYLHSADEEGDQPVHAAAWNSHVQMLQMLLDAGAQVGRGEAAGFRNMQLLSRGVARFSAPNVCSASVRVLAA